MIKTFISHSKSEDKFVNWLAAKLQRDIEQLDIFVDHWQNRTGDNAQEMIEEVKKCIIFISILSNQYIDSTFCLNERQVAKDNNKHEFPIIFKIDETKIPTDLKIKFEQANSVRGILYNDFSNKCNWENRYELLVRSISDKIVELGLLGDKAFYQDCEHIDIVVKQESPTHNEIKTIFNVYLKREEFQKYFFYRLDNPFWLQYFKIYGYLKSNPQPIKEDNSVDYYVPDWPILSYLEKMTNKLINTKQNGKCLDDLFEIIKDVTNGNIDNPRTWASFVRILSNIPAEKIPVWLLELVPKWLTSKFGATMLSDDIALKLLPQFLANKPTKDDIEKAEKVFESIIEIKWKEKPNGFIETFAGVTDEPYLVVDHHWLTESLINEKNAQKMGEKCSDKPIFVVVDKLKTIFRKQMNPSGFDVKIDNNLYRVVVNHTNGFKFKCFGGTLDEEKRKELEGHEKFFRKMLYFPEKQFEFVITNCRSDNNFAERMISNIEATNLGQIENDFSNRMIHFYKSMFNDFSYIWYRNLADVPHWIDSSSAKELLVLILKELIVAKVRIDRSIGKKIIELFLGDSYQYPLFRRFVLLIISEFWHDLQNIFEQIIKEPNADLWFDDIYFETELYILLEKNISKLSTSVKDRLKEIINNEPQRNLPAKNKEKYVNYWKQKWYSALKADAEFAELYEHYHNLTKTKEHISFKEPGVQTRSGPGPSPLSAEQILSMPNNEIANFLTTFKTKDWWEGPTEEALSDMLKQSVMIQPEKFVEDLSPFSNVSYKYVIDILWGLRDTWNNKKTFDWSKLLEFIKDYINRDDFWQDKLSIAGDHWKPNHPWVISAIGDLIQDGTKDDLWTFDESYNTIAQEIISIILTDEHIADLKSDGDEKEPHYITDVHNTPLGNIIIALIYLSLRIARLQYKQQASKQQDSQKWSDELKALYEETIEKNIIEAYTLFGQYLTNFTYLDKTWAEQKIQDLEKPKQEAFWRAFMTGYLNTIRVYDFIYELPSMQNHYEKALETMTDDQHSNERIVHHIAIGYLRGDDSLFNKILAKWQPSQILEIIKFFSRKSEYLLKPDIENKDTLIPRIIDFWNKVYEKYKDVTGSLLSEDDKQILSEVTKLTIYLKEISKKEFDWLMLSAPYVHISSNERWLLEYFDELKDKGDRFNSTRYILQIMLKMLKSYIYGYAQEYVKSIINHAYELSDEETKKMANDISNIVGAAGFEYLRSIYEKYNKLKELGSNPQRTDAGC